MIKQKKRTLPPSIRVSKPLEVEPPNPTPKVEETSKIIIINGEAFLNEEPPKVHLKSDNSVLLVDTGLGFRTQRSLVISGERCSICMMEDDNKKTVTIFAPCKHWAHFHCLKKHSIDNCNTCFPKNRPIDMGQSSTYTRSLENEFGEVGFTTSFIPQDKGKVGIITKFDENIGRDKGLNFKANINEFMKDPDVTLKSYQAAGKTMSDVRRLTGISTRYDMEQKGLDFYLVCDKKFMVSCEIMKNEFSIDRSYVIKKCKERTWPFPSILVKDPESGDQLKKVIHPLELMYRRGFNKRDFLFLGWNEKNFIEDGGPKVIRDKIFYSK